MQLFERDMTLAAMDQVVSDALAGRGGAFFVVGSAGLGKTSVLNQLVRTTPEVFRALRVVPRSEFARPQTEALPPTAMV
jgi:hypothetical protein